MIKIFEIRSLGASRSDRRGDDSPTDASPLDGIAARRAFRLEKSDRRVADALGLELERQSGGERRKDWEYPGWWDEFEKVEIEKGQGKWMIWMPWMLVISYGFWAIWRYS